MNKLTTISAFILGTSLLTACNDSDSSSGSGGGSGSDSTVTVASFDDTTPSPRGQRSEQYPMSSDKTGELTKMLTGAFSGELPSGSSAEGLSPLMQARTTTSPSASQYYIDEVIRQVEIIMASHERQVSRNLQARNDGPAIPDFQEDFEIPCEPHGGIVGKVTDTTATVDMGCEIDEGEGESLRLTGNIAVEVSENLENIDPDSCLSDEITINAGFNDLWFRTLNNGSIEDSVYFDADMAFSFQETDCDAGSFTSSFSGDQIVLMVETPTESDFIGMFDYDYSVAVDGTTDIITTNMQATFDTDELDGVLDYTVTDMAFNEDADYPYAGEFKLESDGDSLTFTFNSDVPDEDDAVEFKLTGSENCNWSGSWNELNELDDGDISCE